jgi:hypothetical protein
MANANAPFGLKPIRGAFSQPYNDGAQPYAKAAADTAVVRYGDPVVVTGAETAEGVPIVTLATAGSTNAITGIAVGFRPLGVSEWLGYAPASTLYEVLVTDNPDGEYLIQEDSDGGALAAGSTGLNAAIVFGAATGNQSAAMLDSSTAATTAGLQVRILGLAQIPGNAIGNYAVWRVRLNNVTTTPNAASTGA